jgi:hypothetical protein
MSLLGYNNATPIGSSKNNSNSFNETNVVNKKDDEN